MCIFPILIYGQRASASIQEQGLSVCRKAGNFRDGQTAAKGRELTMRQDSYKRRIVRQLLLPGHVNDAKAILKYLHDTYQDSIYISMMSQFTPIALKDYPEINRTVTRREYERLIDLCY